MTQIDELDELKRRLTYHRDDLDQTYIDGLEIPVLDRLIARLELAERRLAEPLKMSAAVNPQTLSLGYFAAKVSLEELARDLFAVSAKESGYDGTLDTMRQEANAFWIELALGALKSIARQVQGRRLEEVAAWCPALTLTQERFDALVDALPFSEVRAGASGPLTLIAPPVKLRVEIRDDPFEGPTSPVAARVDRVSPLVTVLNLSILLDEPPAEEPVSRETPNDPRD